MSAPGDSPALVDELVSALARVIGFFRTSPDFYEKNERKIFEAFFGAKRIYQTLPPDAQGLFAERLSALKPGLGIHALIYMESFLAALEDSPEAVSRRLGCICGLAADMDDPLEGYYICFQAHAMAFRDSRLSIPGGHMKRARANALRRLRSGLEGIEPIPRPERDRDFIAVLTPQLLGEGHAPTKTALDRCRALIKMGKRVKLICTAEMYAPSGKAPFYNASLPNIRSEYSQLDSFAYEGLEIPFYQCGRPMPDTEELAGIAGYIKETKPWMAVSIGECLTADIIDGIVPVITVSTVFSVLPDCGTTFRVIAGRLSDGDRRKIQAGGGDPAGVIESVFTFKKLAARNAAERKDFGLPEGKFLILVVGTRLDYEVTDEFLSAALSLAADGAHLVFMGAFSRYGEKCGEMPALARHSSFIGFQSDVGAVYRLCQLYLSPKRLGGGGAIIEAMSEGLPAVTLNYGDGAVSAGKAFHAASYEEMTGIARRYMKDKAFYSEMSRLAKERAGDLTDTDRHFKDMIEKAEGSGVFW